MDRDVAIVGAGPYGLSLAAHLRHRGVNFVTFGKPMDTWRRQMPAAMLLKSDAFASNLCAPQPGWRLGDYCRRGGVRYGDREPRVSLDLFTEYAGAFQRELVPDLDQRMVTAVRRAHRGFVLTLDDGDAVTARRVILAVGITHFSYVPPALRDLGDRVTHSSAHRVFDGFAGQRVAVVGAGSSAVEVSASLLDVGADVHLVARRGEIPFWGEPPVDPPPPTWWDRVRNPSSGIGPGIRSKLCEELPDAFRVLPPDFRLEVVRRHLGPASGWWLRDKVLGKATIHTGTNVRGASVSDDEVAFRLLTGGTEAWELRVDHVIAATGYTADVDRLTFLSSDIRKAVKRVGTMPALSLYFQSSVPGLYFVGLAAAGSFGPLMRFMVGAEFVTPRITAHLSRKARQQSGQPRRSAA